MPNIRNNAQQRLRFKLGKDAVITKEMIDRELLNPIKKTRGLTRPPGYEDQPYCYYYLEDGECSLNNPVVWKRLTTYIYKLVRFTPWIHKKSAIDPTEVLMEVQEEIRDMHPSQYGAAEKTDAITFLIHKINTQVGREWWKYLKVNEPHYYNKLIEMQKYPAGGKRKYKSQQAHNAKNQKKNCEELKESYLIGCIQHDLKYATGMAFTSDEIRATYPHLIEQKRAAIISKRAKKQLAQ